MSGIPYQALDASRREIRVLDLLPGRYRSPIKCRLRTVSIADKKDLPYYAGLSYTWGAPLPSKTICISVGGKDYTVEIGLNLFRAIQGLRSRWKNDTLWVDALSINQADNDERASQVSFMGEIYSRASTVYIWLGTTVLADSPRHELTSARRMMLHCSSIVAQVPKGLKDFAARLPSELYQTWRLNGLHLDSVELVYLKAYRNILFMGVSATPYRIEKALQSTTPCWTERAWVLQEFALSSSAQICFDRTKLPYECYYLYISGGCVPEVCQRTRDLSTLLFEIWYPLQQTKNVFGPPLASHSRSLQGILPLARSAALSQSSNLQDKVFAFLGMVREEEAREIVVDYNIPFWVTCARATYASAKHNRDEWNPHQSRCARLSVLEVASFADDRPPSFPSWAADFSRLIWRTPYESFSTPFGWPGSGDHYDVSLSPDLRCLTTYGVIFGSVAASFTLYAQRDEDSSTNARFDDGDHEYSCLTTGTSVPAVLATLLAELTILALQNRGPIAAGVLDNSKLQPEKLLDLASQLKKQQINPYVEAEVVLGTLQTCFAYWQRALASEQSSYTVPWDPRSYELQVSSSYAFLYYLNIHSIRLFASTNGYVGFAPDDVEPGDTIVFLRGAEWPAVLRQYEDRWELRGFVYVCGVMQGELKDGDGLREWEVEPFVLC
ncbi:hypothetical protein LTR56_012853 [Elasticomyces elasticus]|nr:hypothetical protein LTR56_012853 [Elasticomyces elasticus]KAK3650779.1 hypothetical protein LTR22_012378 [Elasticomyces elasticus]KAK4918483.1 hypothetical protein LTR49_013716 [Elasticomyces elasticus]KAK5757878.1 hypothetical protein LTS12_012062 [Elasticomyces elasticus]